MVTESTFVLTSDQLAVLRSLPPAGSRNRLKMALTLSGARQSDICQALSWGASQVNRLVTGTYGDVPLEQARQLAWFFGIAIEDLFPAGGKS